MSNEQQHYSKYVFDVDNTLTPPRGIIDPSMKELLYQLPEVYYVSGSPLLQIQDQLGLDLLKKAKIVFGCSGNELIVPPNCDVVIKREWKYPDELLAFLENELRTVDFKLQYKNPIHLRTGSINFTPVGRNAYKTARATFVKWDSQTKYRIDLQKRLLQQFPDLAIDIGGEVSIDIYPIGKGKEQIVHDIGTNDFIFFGDKIHVGGNDYKLASLAKTSYNVKNWNETYSILKGLIDDKI